MTNLDSILKSRDFLRNPGSKMDGETLDSVRLYSFLTPKSPQMVIVAMKLKDAYSLEGKLWPI